MIHPDVVSAVGRTPLVELQRVAKGLGARVVAKLEAFNPSASVKDRVAAAMISSWGTARIFGGSTAGIAPTSGAICGRSRARSARVRITAAAPSFSRQQSYRRNGSTIQRDSR